MHCGIPDFAQRNGGLQSRQPVRSRLSFTTESEIEGLSWCVDVQSAALARIQRVATASSRMAAFVYVSLHFCDAKVEIEAILNDRSNESLDYTFKTIPRLKIIPKYVETADVCDVDLRFSCRRFPQFLVFDAFFQTASTIHDCEVCVLWALWDAASSLHFCCLAISIPNFQHIPMLTSWILLAWIFLLEIWLLCRCE